MVLLRNVTVLFDFSLLSPTRTSESESRSEPGIIQEAPTPSSTRRPHEWNYLDTIYLRETSLYFLKLAIDQITSAAPAQNDAGGTVEE